MEATTGTRRSRRNTAKEAGEEAARESFLNLDHDDDAAAAVEHSTEATKVERDEGFDIFENVGFAMSQKGVKVTYTIKKNNELAGVKKHPYSWIQLGRDFGPGDYQVIAKDPNRKYISSERQTISEDAAIFDDTDESDEQDPTEQAISKIAFQQPQMNFMEIFGLIQGQNDRAKSEAREQAALQAQSQVGMITAMTEMMKNSQIQSAQMLLEMTKMMSSVTKEMSATQEKLMEKMNARMDKIAELATKKDEGPSWVEIMKMQNESQEKGFELFSKLAELAETKADEKLAILDERRGDGETPKKSMTDTLIETMLPLIAASMVGQNRLAAGAIPQAPSQNRRQLPQPRAAQAAGGVAQTNRPVQRRPGAQAPSPQAAAPQAVERSVGESGGGSGNGGQGAGQSLLTRERPIIVDGNLQEKGPVLEIVRSGKAEFDQEESAPADTDGVDLASPEWVRKKCLSVLPGELGQLMVDQTPPADAAPKVLKVLQDQGISREQFLGSVSNQDLVDVGRQYSLPEEALEWLNEVYAHLSNQPGNDAGGQLNASL